MRVSERANERSGGASDRAMGRNERMVQYPTRRFHIVSELLNVGNLGDVGL